MPPPHWAMLLPFPYRVAWPNECARSDRRPEKLIPPLISQIFPSDIAVLLEFGCVCFVCVRMSVCMCKTKDEVQSYRGCKWNGHLCRWWGVMAGNVNAWMKSGSFIHLPSPVLLHRFYHPFISYLMVKLCLCHKIWKWSKVINSWSGMKEKKKQNK